MWKRLNEQFAGLDPSDLCLLSTSQMESRYIIDKYFLSSQNCLKNIYIHLIIGYVVFCLFYFEVNYLLDLLLHNNNTFNNLFFILLTHLSVIKIHISIHPFTYPPTYSFIYSSIFTFIC